MMQNDSEFEQSYEADDSQYNFILGGNETEVEVTTINEQRAASPKELDSYVLKS